nr:sterol desaturase family protein [Micromonospora sp. DSM 115978]
MVAVAGLLTVLTPLLHGAFPDRAREALLDLPVWAQFCVVLLLADLANYAGHRALHEVPVLWRFHAVHHSSRDLDWLSTSRGHPVDQVVNLVAVFAPLVAIGFSVQFSAAFLVFQFYYPFLAHANTRILLR